MASTTPHPGPLESAPSTKDRKVAYKTPVTGQHQGQSHMTKWTRVSSNSRQDQTWVSSGLALTPESRSSLAGEKRNRSHISPIKLNAF